MRALIRRRYAASQAVHRPVAPVIVSIVALAFTAPASGGTAKDSGRTARSTPIARYSVVERSLPFRSAASNPWEDVRADVKLLSPSRKPYRIGGFYSGRGIWKFRFAPAETGRWIWTGRVREGSRSRSYRGGFTVVRGSSPGFVRRSPFNSLRWTFDNRTPYYPIGLNECTKDLALANWGLDGDFRANGQEAGQQVDMTTYLRTYGAAGFNLFRWGPDNCSYGLFDRIDPSGNALSRAGGAATDLLFQRLRRSGFRIEMVLFGSNPPFAGGGSAVQLAAVQRYVKYVVDRYGAYVDFWELVNEAAPGEAWLTQVGDYLRRIDPYAHPVGTSWSAPQLPTMQFGTDHWYQTEDASESDAVAWSRLRGEQGRAFGKPTLVDEQGNLGQNWDPTSARRVRLRSWTAFFAEASLVFWNTSFAKDYRNPGGAANVYLGPEERRYVRALQNYTQNFDPRAVVVKPEIAPGAAARGYALRGPRNFGLYLVAAGDQSGTTTGVRVKVALPRRGSAVWLVPASGRVIGRATLSAGEQSLTAPPFTVDLALKITY